MGLRIIIDHYQLKIQQWSEGVTTTCKTEL